MLAKLRQPNFATPTIVAAANIHHPLSHYQHGVYMDIKLIIWISCIVAIVIVTAGLEFIYAQSPNSMKGLLTGLFYLWYGIFNAAGIIFYGNFVANQEYKTRSGIIHSAIATCIGVVSVLLYMVVACLYKNRIRPTDRDDIEDDALRQGRYGNVSTLNFPDRIENSQLYYSS